MALDRSKVLQQAQLLASRGQYENAVVEWKKLAAESPHDGSIHNTIGDLHLKRNATVEAADAFLQAATAFKTEGAILKAIAAYKKALKCDPTKYEVYQHLGDLNAERGLVSSAVQDYLMLAKHYLKERKPKEALAVYQKIIGIDPSNQSAQQRIAELCLQDNRQEEAMKVYLQLGRERSSQGRYEEARDAYLAVLRIDPKNSEAAQFVESIKSGRTGSIIPLRSQSPSSTPQLSEPLGPLAEAVRRMDEGQYDGAEAILNQMLAREPGNPQVCQLLARLHLQRGDLQVALGEYRFLAGAALRAQDFLLAEFLINEFLSAQPDSVPLLELYGELYEKQNDPASAAAQYARAVEILLAHPEPGMEGYHEELFEKVRSLSPDTSLTERLAARIKGVTARASSDAVDDSSATSTVELSREGAVPNEGGAPSVVGIQSRDLGSATSSTHPASVPHVPLADAVPDGASPFEKMTCAQPGGLVLTNAEPDGYGLHGRNGERRDGARHASQEKGNDNQPPASEIPLVAAVSGIDHEAHFTLGVAYKNMGLYAEAREEFDVSRTGSQFYLDSCLMAALCFKEEGRLAQAMGELEAVLSDPRCEGAKGQAIRYELGLLYEADSQWAKAVTTFQSIPSFHDVPQRLTALKGKNQSSAGSLRLAS